MLTYPILQSVNKYYVFFKSTVANNTYVYFLTFTVVNIYKITKS